MNHSTEQDRGGSFVDDIARYLTHTQDRVVFMDVDSLSLKNVYGFHLHLKPHLKKKV